MISVSKLLQIYFPHVDIQNVNVQKGIVRGKYLDQSIENLFLLGKPNHPDPKLLGISIENLNAVDFNELSDECERCWDAFSRFQKETKCKIVEVQKRIEIPTKQLRGIIDALIELKGQKYIVDWKSKRKYTDYQNVNYEEHYYEYCDWCAAMGVKSSGYDLFLEKRKALYSTYNLGNLRYVLQVTYYWYLLGCPVEFELLIAYFTSEGEYLLFTFNKKSALKVALSLLEHKDSSEAAKEYLRDKLNRFSNWSTILGLSQVY